MTRTDLRIQFLYDYRGRRVEKRTFVRHAGVWAVSSVRRFLYEGWTLVAEFSLDGASPVLDRTHLWGIDLSGSLEGAGGIGGLLRTRLHSPTGSAYYYPTYDADGNVSEYLDAAGTVAAHYEYAPFGKTVAATESMADAFAFRFSTKYLDAETGLLYYGYRHLDPETGRWLSRDPLGEQGGANLYAFVGNGPFEQIDALGLAGKWNPLGWPGQAIQWGGNSLAGTGIPGLAQTGVGIRVVGQVAEFPATQLEKPFTGVAAGVRDYKSSTISGVYRVDYDIARKRWISTPVSGINDPLVRNLKDVFVNGVLNDAQHAARLAGEHTNVNGGTNSAILLHNPTSGFFPDVTETGLDIFFGNSSVADSVADQLEQRQWQDLTLILHSQGGAIGSAALNKLADRGIATWCQLKVEHHGSASSFLAARHAAKRVGATWLDPKIHYVDIVPNLVAGYGITNPLRWPGVPLSILVSPLLISPISPHTIYHR